MVKTPYTCLYREIWNSPQFEELTESGKLVFFYLLSTPMGNGLGCFKAGFAAMIEESGMDERHFKEGFDQNINTGLVEHDDNRKTIFIPQYFKRNPPSNPNVMKALGKQFAQIPKGPLKTKIYIAVRTWCEERVEGFGKAFAECFEEPIESSFPRLLKPHETNKIDELPKPESIIHAKPETDDTREANRLCELMRAEMLAEKPDAKVNITKEWIAEMERMIRIDRRPSDKIEAVIKWACHDHGEGRWAGWAVNVRSPGKLRQKYDQLELAMNKTHSGPLTAQEAKKQRDDAILKEAWQKIQGAKTNATQ